MPDEKQDGPQDPDEEEMRPFFRPLEYQREAGKYQPVTPYGVQVLAGFIVWVLGLAFVVEAATGRGWGAPLLDQQNSYYCAIAVALIGAGTLAIWLRLRFRWRGFLPGLLIGFGLSCLVPIGIVLIICGTNMR